jgi:hypothetical protein
MDAARIPGPRLAGVREHLERVNMFLGVALAQTNPAVRFRLSIAAVYSCRAISELMLTAAEKQEVKTFCGSDDKANRDALEQFYYLIERIRIHDFHRFGLTSPWSARAVTSRPPTSPRLWWIGHVSKVGALDTR